ncbi:MAG: hypothetical protein SPI12_02905 [Actinomycetaceae bacterium]|nr:hypothetical protein [Actinomycetaceae bacterium]MDY6082798.1 hypothetical protein [Actinomycetaceae bacterium]
MTTYALVMARDGLPSVDEQRSAVVAVSGTDAQIMEFSPLSQADVETGVQNVLNMMHEADVLAVSSLGILGLGDRPLLTVVDGLGTSGFGLIAASEGINVPAHDAFFSVVAKLEAGAEASRRAQAGAIIARAMGRDAVTPQKAEFVPAEYADMVPEKDVH